MGRLHERVPVGRSCSATSSRCCLRGVCGTEGQTCVAETVPGGMPAPESSGGGAGGLGGRGVSWPTSSGTMDGIHGGKIRWKSVEMTSGGGRGSRAGRGDDSSRAKASDDSGTPGRRLLSAAMRQVAAHSGGHLPAHSILRKSQGGDPKVVARARASDAHDDLVARFAPRLQARQPFHLIATLACHTS